MPRRIYADSVVQSTWVTRTLAAEGKRVGERFERIRAAGLQAFAREVRRRARIRISVNRNKGGSNYPAGHDDTRYAMHLKDTISWYIDEAGGSILFDVGGVPYVNVEDKPKDSVTIMQGNPTMRFYSYKLGRPVAFTAPAVVYRHGKNFFTGAFQSAVDDFDKIMGRAYDREIKKVPI